jgi:MFS family permease
MPNPWRGLSNLPTEVWVLFTTTLINRAGTMALPFLVLYLTEGIGLQAGRAGLAVTFYGLGALVTAPVAGRLCDRAGAVRVMKASLFLSGFVLLLFPLTRGFVAILAITFTWAIVSEAFRPASLAILSDLVAPEQRKAAFAVSRLAINLGMSVGPVVGGFLAMVSFPALFLVDGATSILAGVVLSLSPWRTSAQAPATEHQAHGAASPPLARRGFVRDRRLIYFLLALLPVLFAFFQHEAALPLFLVRDLGLPESAYGMLFAVNTVLIILIEVPLNAAMANWSDRRSLCLGALLTGAGFGALALATGFFSVAATFVIWTFGEMITFPSASAYIANIAPPDRRGEYMGYYQMTFSLAFAVTPWLGTEMLERFGASTLWLTTLALGVVSAAVLLKAASKPLSYQEEAARA